MTTDDDIAEQRIGKLIEEPHRRLEQLTIGILVLLNDVRTHRQLTPTEHDIQRLVAGEMSEAEVEQLLRRGR